MIVSVKAMAFEDICNIHDVKRLRVRHRERIQPTYTFTYTWDS